MAGIPGLIVLVLIGNLAYPNIVIQHKMIQGITVTDFTNKESDFFKKVIGEKLGFQFPDYPQLRQGYTANTLHECPFTLIFFVPSEQVETFRVQIMEHFNPSSDLPGFRTVTVDGEKAYVKQSYQFSEREWTYFYEYETDSGEVYFKLSYTDAPDEWGKLFKKRVRPY